MSKTASQELEALNDEIQAQGTVKSFSINGITVTSQDQGVLEERREKMEQRVFRPLARKRTRPDFS